MALTTGTGFKLKEASEVLTWTHRLHISISKSNSSRCFAIESGSWPSFHIDDDDKLDTSVGKPAVHSQSLIDSLEKSKVLVCCLVRQSSFEDIQT
jgi:hypothetical protein